MPREKCLDCRADGGERRAEPRDFVALDAGLPLNFVVERLELFARHLRVGLSCHRGGASLDLGERSLNLTDLA